MVHGYSLPEQTTLTCEKINQVGHVDKFGVNVQRGGYNVFFFFLNIFLKIILKIFKEKGQK